MAYVYRVGLGVQADAEIAYHDRIKAAPAGDMGISTNYDQYYQGSNSFR